MAEVEPVANARIAATPMPAELRKLFNGSPIPTDIIAWAEFDLDERNHFRRQVAALTDSTLVIAMPAVQVLQIAQITEANIVEGLGVDRLVVFIDGKVAAELPYSRACRREMQKLHRLLKRRLPKTGEIKESDPPPAWLDAVERKLERQTHCPKCNRAIPDYANGVCPACLQKKAILFRLLAVAKPYRRRLRWALLVTLLATAVNTLPPMFSRYQIDRGLGTGDRSPDMSQLLLWTGLALVAIVLQEFLNGVRLYHLAMVGTSVARDLRHNVYAHLHDLGLRFFAKRRTGSLITRVTNDTDRLWDFIVFGSVDFFRNVLSIVLISIVMLFINWELTLVSLAPLPILAGITYWRSRQMHRMFGRLWTYWSRMGAVVGDAIPGVRVVKAFANEDREVARFDRRSNEYTVKEQEVNRLWSQLQPVISAAMRIGGVLTFFVGGFMHIRHPADDRYSVGTLIAFGNYMWLFYFPIMELANSNRMVTRAASSAQRVFEVLDTPPEVFTRSGAVRHDHMEGRIEFRNVSFTYEGASPALRDLSLTIEPGEMIGLCGPSGAGKSTLVNLICRFYDPTEGQILVDGVDVRDYDVKWLRRNVGLVLQEPHLFHGTIADNIRYGHPDASNELVIQAAKAANAHNFVVGFPDGYDTLVGERGQSLSGGERQRISIARAILHNPKILILDEATSSVDTETEKQIQQALDHLVQGRTTIAIAHRLSTLQAANRLVVLDKGKLVEQGTHAQLLDRPEGVYAKLYKTQMEMNQQVAIR